MKQRYVWLWAIGMMCGWLSMAVADEPQATDYILPTDADVRPAPEIVPGVVPYERSFSALYCQDSMITTPTGSCIPTNCFQSETQQPNASAGSNMNTDIGAIVADDFVVPAGQTWIIDKITTFGYQTYASYPVSTFTSCTVKIWDGDPSAGTPNLLRTVTTLYPPQSSTFTAIFRTDYDWCTTSRPLYDLPNPISPGLELTAGTYWVGFQAEGTLDSGPWITFVTTTGQYSTITGHHAMQYWDGAWRQVAPGKEPQDVPFCIEGTMESTYAVGDLNCDGSVNLFDVDAFVVAMTSASNTVPFDDYYAAYPDCDATLADCNDDGTVNLFDVDPFVELLV